MINDKELKLLMGLLREVDKHGLDTFHSLKGKLQDSKSLDFNFITDAIALRRKSKASPRVDYNVKIDKVLENITEEKNYVFNQLTVALKSKSVIKNMVEFTSFLNLHGIQTKKLSSWNEGIFKLVKECESRDINYIDNVYDSYNHFETSYIDDRSLDGWSDIILKKKNDNSD